MDYDERKKNYCNLKQKNAILTAVFFLHLSAIVVPIIYNSLFDDSNTPKEYTINVGISAPRGDSMDIPQTQTLPQDQPKSTPQTQNDVLPLPQKVTENIPEVAQLPEIKPQPEPETTKTPKVNEKAVPTEKINPPKKDPPKKQESTILRPDQIKVDRTIKGRNIAQTSADNSRKNELQKNLTAMARELRQYGTNNPGENGLLMSKDIEEYYEKLKNYIEPKWRQPDMASLGGKRPSVTIELSISKNGKIESSSIRKKSGIRAMDQSVEVLLSSLKTVPVPPNGAIKTNITLTVN